MTDQQARRVSVPLGFCIVVMPYFFSWLLLRRGYSFVARRFAFGWLAVVGLSIFLIASAPGRLHPASAVAAMAARQDVDLKKAGSVVTPALKDIDPAEERKRNNAVLAEVQQRLEKNRERLKTRYPNALAVETGSSDLAKVTAIAVSRGMSKIKEDQEQAAQAKALSVQVAEQLRLIYASSMENGFMKSGMDASVSAVGKSKERLIVSYALMSQPMIYRLQNENQLPSKAKALGFKQIRYTNGFESELGKTWTVDLSQPQSDGW